MEEIPDRAPAAPPVFGRYEVRRSLGAGGYGEVFLGHDSQLDRPVAIKVLHAVSDQPLTEGSPALQEARKLAQLRHPGIVAVHDVGMHAAQLYIVSDYVDGPNLRHWLRSNRPSWPEAARIAAAIADALSHAHARLIIHRDIKPANIILAEDRAPVLVDFGLALGEAQAGAGEKGVVFGSPSYMSPEQAQGDGHRIDGRTDLYSLGVVLYEMLTGRVPFRATEFTELLRQVCEDEAQPPRQLARDVPPELERICLKALAKRQEDRHSTAADLAEDLRRVLLTETRTPASGETRVEPPADAPSPPTPTPVRAETPTPGARRTSREAERRQLTVLVSGCKFFESEAYLALDPEDQAHLLRTFQEPCEEAVRQFGGAIVQSTDGRLVACFGFPVAYEDAVERAVRAGLGILDAMKGSGGTQDTRQMRPWVAIHTGAAVAEVKADTVSLVGEARNVAVRLEDVALAGEVICTDATQRLLQRRFHCASLGLQKIKSAAHPVELFRIEQVATAGNPIDAVAPAELSPLTGRDLEIGLLTDRWERASEGVRQVVLLVGEPGLGKSRLVHTMKERVLGQMLEGETDAPVIEWRGSPHFQNTELYPAIDFYERALAFDREEAPEARFERLLDRLEQYGLAQPETVPLWASLLSLPPTDRYPAAPLSPVRQREETFRIMLEWLQARAERRPILFIVEDLHWVDASTLEFLRQFFAEGPHDSILTLLTFRPEFTPPWPTGPHQTSLSLNRLTRRQVGDLMTRKTKRALPDAVIQQVYDRTAGVPLLVEELTKMAHESGVLERAGDSRSETLVASEIPASLQDLLMARLDRLDGDREVIQLAATLGREFSHELFSAASGMDDAILAGEIGKLVQAEILHQKGRPPRCRYVFKHALLEEAAYGSLVKDRRQQFHRRIAETLEDRFPHTVDAQPELMAHHFTEAGLIPKGTAYWLKAGLRSRDRSAYHEAIGHLTKALTLLERLEDTDERHDLELRVLSALGPAYIAVRGYAAPEAGPILHRARELCERAEQPSHLFGILLGTWEWRLVRGDIRMCLALAADGMALAERVNDPGMLMEALFMPGVTQFYRGEFADSRAYYEKAVALYDDRERTKLWAAFTGHNAGVTHRCYLALTLWHLGYPDQAAKVDREARELAGTIGHAFSTAHAIDFTACLYQNCRLGAEVQRAADEEVAIATEQGFQLWHALGVLHKGAGMLLQDRIGEAIPILVEGLQAFRATGAKLRIPYYLSMLGDAYTQAGRFEEAHKVLDEALATAEKNDDRFHEAELHRLAGELLLAESRDHSGAAEACFQRAIDVARRQHSRAWELRATLGLARLWLGQDRRQEAVDALGAVYGSYTEGFATPDLVDAKALLKHLAEADKGRQDVGGVLLDELHRMTIPPGTTLGRYEVRSKLGAGAMGDVYLADDLRLRRPVAVKLLRLDAAANKDRLQYFEREALTASSLNHPNILTIYEIGHQDDHRFIVTEFIDGESLGDRIGRGALGLIELLDIGIQLASALAAAHEAGVVHRDIKPDNVMVRPDGVLKVLDFGLAKLTEQMSSTDQTILLKQDVHSTLPGTIVGTVRYMSPEQARGQNLDTRTDIWSLGVVLYEMAVAHGPFEGDSMSDVLAAILTTEPPALGSFPAGVPAELERIVSKALKKDKAERYQLASDLGHDLKVLKQQLELEAEAPGGARLPQVAPQATPGTPPTGRWSVSQFRGRRALLVLAATLAATVALGYAGYTRFSGTGSAPGITSIAVLPFANSSNDPEQDYLSDGISESLTNRLSELPGMKVISYTSSLKYRGRDSEPEEVARALGVSGIMTGRVLRRGDTTSISVELVDGRDQTQVWGERYDRKTSDLLAVQAEIASEIAGTLRLHLADSQKPQVAAAPQDGEAYELLLKGRYFRAKGGTADRQRAAEYFKQAIAKDPSSAPAYADLSDIQRSLAASGIVDPGTYLAVAEASARKAIELDQNLAEGHYALANLRTYAWDWDEAEHEYKRAIEVNPNLALAHRWYATYLRLFKRDDEAIAEITRARDLDPLSAGVNATVGYIYASAGQYDRALEILKKTIELEKTYPYTHAFLGFTYAASGKPKEAVAAYQQAIELGLNTPTTRILLGMAHARAGDRASAQAILKQLLDAGTQVSPAELAILYGNLGEKEQAFALLEKAYEARDLQLQYLGVDVGFEPLRSDPRFADLMRRVGLIE